jgi:hypothetical protein
MVPLLADRALFCRLPSNMRRYCPMASGGFTLSLRPACGLSPSYVLGLLNSRMLFWLLRNMSNRFRGGWITCTKQYTGKLPIRPINFSDAAEKARHDKIVALVETMLDLHKKLKAARNPHDQESLRRLVEATDREIDARVYELYGLTGEEIKIVEGG